MIDTGNTLRMFSFEEKTKQQRLAMGMIQWPPFYIYVFAQDPVLAVEAVQVVDENVDQDQAVIINPSK